MKVKVKKLHEKAVLPSFAHVGDAGADLVAVSKTKDEKGNVIYGIGIAIEIPKGYVDYLFSRSSIHNKNLILTNCVGVIDSTYRGELKMAFKCLKSDFLYSNEANYAIGDRIGQLIIMPIPEVEYEFSETLSETDRGDGGYGSTGK